MRLKIILFISTSRFVKYSDLREEQSWITMYLWKLADKPWFLVLWFLHQTPHPHQRCCLLKLQIKMNSVALPSAGGRHTRSSTPANLCCFYESPVVSHIVIDIDCIYIYIYIYVWIYTLYIYKYISIYIYIGTPAYCIKQNGKFSPSPQPGWEYQLIVTWGKKIKKRTRRRRNAKD